MDTPVMMSALVRGMLFTVRQMPRKRLPRFRKPMAAAVPATGVCIGLMNRFGEGEEGVAVL